MIHTHLPIEMTPADINAKIERVEQQIEDCAAEVGAAGEQRDALWHKIEKLQDRSEEIPPCMLQAHAGLQNEKDKLMDKEADLRSEKILLQTELFKLMDDLRAATPRPQTPPGMCDPHGHSP